MGWGVTHSLWWCSKIAYVKNWTLDITFSSETPVKCVWPRMWKSTWWFWGKTKEKFLPRHRKPLSDLVCTWSTGNIGTYCVLYSYSPVLRENTECRGLTRDHEFSRKKLVTTSCVAASCDLWLKHKPCKICILYETVSNFPMVLIFISLLSQTMYLYIYIKMYLCKM